MSLPTPLGALEQMLNRDGRLVERLGWHHFLVKSPNGGNAGRWAREHIEGFWTFKPDFGHVEFFIKEDRDAMFFKLTWGGE